ARLSCHLRPGKRILDVFIEEPPFRFSIKQAVIDIRRDPKISVCLPAGERDVELAGTFVVLGCGHHRGVDAGHGTLLAFSWHSLARTRCRYLIGMTSASVTVAAVTCAGPVFG